MNAKALLLTIVFVCVVTGAVLIVLFGSGAFSEAEKPARTTQPEQVVAPSTPQLQHVALLFRHTVRAPRVFPPNDTLLRPGLFPRGVQRSTREGLIATRNATLRWQKAYKDFLTGDPNEVYARTSQADRCSETLSMVVNTWYPSPDDLPLSQVSIRMPPKGKDKYVENCGKMSSILRDYDPEYPVADSIFNEEGFRTVGDYVNFLRNTTALPNESVNFFYMAYMEGFLSVDFEGSHSRKDHWMFNYSKTREFVRLYLLDCSINVMAPYYAHFLMNGIADQLESAAQKASPFKLSLFSFHDLNLLSVLRALGIRDKATNPLAAIFFELWKDRSGYRVALRMTAGINTDSEYQPEENLAIRDGTAQIETLPELLTLMRNYYKDQLNLTNCGYFGDDAKI